MFVFLILELYLTYRPPGNVTATTKLLAPLDWSRQGRSIVLRGREGLSDTSWGDTIYSHSIIQLRVVYHEQS